MPTAIPFLVSLLESSRVGLHLVARVPLSILGTFNLHGKTIAHDRASCDVHGMPGEAAALQVAAQIADELTRIVRSRNDCGTTTS